MKFDIKSALCGLAVGVLAVLVMGAESSPSYALSRYQMVAFTSGNNNRASAMIIDTVTGRVWAANLTDTWKEDGKSFFEPKEGR